MITRLVVQRKEPFANGYEFPVTGAYEKVVGKVYGEVDPKNRLNRIIVNLDRASRNRHGRVEYRSDFFILKPADMARGNGKIFLDAPNRGSKRLLSFLNDAPATNDPSTVADAGNGFLMRQGYTIVWCGWQADVPPTPGLMGLHAPEALAPGGKLLVGKILCQFQADEGVSMLYLADRQHLPHAAVDVHDPDAILQVRDHPNAPARPIRRDAWSFVQIEGEPHPHYICLESGFEAGKIYQVVYTTRGSSIVGLGFAAVRDIVSFLKYASAIDGNPCARMLDYAYAFGASQSGRFLRQLIHLGLNEDEAGRMALDGIIPHIAGGMRGEFNLRFGQPSKDVCYIIPELFPFTDTPQTDPVTGQTDSLLARLQMPGKVPKIMFTNTSAEYWRGDAALIHTDLVQMTEAPESDAVRRYHFAGTQHGIGVFPPIIVRPTDGIRGQLPFNTVDYTPLLRAVLTNLDRWVTLGASPPPSCHPRLADGTAVPSKTLAAAFTKIPGVRFPPQTLHALRLDYGPETHLGRTLQLPAVEGEAYPALVSVVDTDGNEIAGIRLPDLTVPLATHTGWNLRHQEVGNPDLVIGITGGLVGWTLPFPATCADREATGDPRVSIAERYRSREDYVRQVRVAAQTLVARGYLLAEDVSWVEAGAVRRYDLWCG